MLYYSTLQTSSSTIPQSNQKEVHHGKPRRTIVCHGESKILYQYDLQNTAKILLNDYSLSASPVTWPSTGVR